MSVRPHILRRYVIERASGRTPRPEWSYYAQDLGAWIRTDEMTARRHQYHQRIRTEGRPWCEVLGHQTSVAEDLPLQLYFMTIDPEDGWSRLAAVAREHPARCLREWQAAGRRIMAAVTPEMAAPLPETPGPLDGWPEKRGEGQRSLLPR